MPLPPLSLSLPVPPSRRSLLAPPLAFVAAEALEIVVAAQARSVLSPPVPVSTSLLAVAPVESDWLISTEPMSGRLPAGRGLPCRVDRWRSPPGGRRRSAPGWRCCS